MDCIQLKRMAFFGYHGDEPEETRLGQRFYIDLTMELDLSKAGKSDALEDSVNYVDVYHHVRAIAEGGPYKLLEKVAGMIIDDLLRTFPLLERVTVVVHKPGAPVPGIMEDISVTLSGERESAEGK